MCFVMQNPLPDHDVACVPFVISACIQIAVVFRERRGGDGGESRSWVRPAILQFSPGLVLWKHEKVEIAELQA
jgi:hypothetical protein